MSYAPMNKAQLLGELEKRDNELRAKGLELEQMRLEVSIATRNAPRTPHKLPAHFVKARETAMKLGRSVKA